MVLFGVDRVAEFSHLLSGRVALLTGPSGRTSGNEPTIDVLKRCCDLRLLLALQPIQMLGYGLFTPGNVYFANENVPPEDRVQGQSLKMVATNGLSGVVGNLLAGAVIDRGGVNAMLAVCALCGAVGVALALFSIHLKKRRAFA